MRTTTPAAKTTPAILATTSPSASAASLPIVGVDFDDPEFREELAKRAYYAERMDDAARDREHEMGDATYLCLAWDCLSPATQRPYRSAVASTLEVIEELTAA